MRENPNGVSLLGAKPTESKMGGWRKIVRDERLLLRQIALIQNSMRAAGVIPEWSNFWCMKYRRDADQFFDSRMWKKFRAWWDLLYNIGDIDRPASKAKLGYAWAFCVCEVMERKHGKPRAVNEAKFGLSAEVAAALREQVLKDFEALTLC